MATATRTRTNGKHQGRKRRPATAGRSTTKRDLQSSDDAKVLQDCQAVLADPASRPYLAIAAHTLKALGEQSPTSSEDTAAGFPPVDFGFRFMKLNDWIPVVMGYRDIKLTRVDETAGILTFEFTAVNGSTFEHAKQVPTNLGVVYVDYPAEKEGYYIGPKDQCEQLKEAVDTARDTQLRLLEFINPAFARDTFEGYPDERPGLIARGVVSRGYAENWRITDEAEV